MTKNGAQLNNLELFCAYYLSHDMKCVVPPFHREMYADIAGDDLQLCFCAPRSFAKSSLLSKFYPLFEILKGNRNKIYIFSSTASLAENWLREIKKELTENKYILADYGDVTTDKWTSDHIICKVGSRKIELRARGRGSQTRGWRPDLIIIDDIDEEDVARQSEQRDRLKDWFDKELINTLEPDGRIAMVGTLVHPLALLADVMGRKSWKVRKYQAFLPNGESLWPEKWSTAQLEARRAEIGSRAFNSEYMNEPIITENPIFVKEYFEDYQPDSEMFKKLESKGLYTVVAIDPAISRKETADYTVILTVSATYDKEPKIYVRSGGGVNRSRIPINRQVAELDRIYRKFSSKIALIETTAYQEALYDEFVRYQEDNHRHLTIKPIKPDRDKERRSHAVVPLLERRQVYFDFSDKMTQRLMDELILFPTGDHDDLVDAFVYSLTEIKKWSKRRNVLRDSKPYIVLPGKRRNSVTGVV